MHKRIHCWSEGLQDVETGEDDQSKKEGIIVEDGKCCCLIVGNFILFPQYSINKTHFHSYTLQQFVG
jgi:hypothetical protein